MTLVSTRAFILARRPDGRPARACAVSRSIHSRTVRCISFGAVTRLRVARMLPGEPGQRVEELRGVLAELGPAGQEAEVGVDARRRRVVVAGPEVDVPPDLVLLPPDDEGDLRVRLQPHDAVDDVDARLLERLGPDDVVLLVEARLQLHEDGDLLAVLGRADERRDDRRFGPGPVERHLDRERLRVVRRPLDHLDDRAEGVVRVVEEDVAGADRREDRGVGRGRRTGGTAGVNGGSFRSRRSSFTSGHEVAAAERAVDLVDLAAR